MEGVSLEVVVGASEAYSSRRMMGTGMIVSSSTVMLGMLRMTVYTEEGHSIRIGYLTPRKTGDGAGWR